MNIIGISAFYHDSASCILVNGKLVAAAQEERFTRIKHDPSFPLKSLKFCLDQAGLAITDIDCVAYYEDPIKKLSRQLWSGLDFYDPNLTLKMDPKRPESEIREKLGFEGLIKKYDHHLSHAASAYFYSGYKSSALLTVDGVGEWATTTYGKASGEKIELFEEVLFPNSLGLFYSSITSYLGFSVNGGEYKVMGLAPYGKPTYVKQLYQMISLEEGGQYRLNLQYFDFIEENRMYSHKFEDLLGFPPRVKESELHQVHFDLAKSLQIVLEEILLQKVKYLYKETGEKNLCMAGGVALNCVANGRILREGPFEKLFVQPASNDAGGALGAAALSHVEMTGKAISTSPIKSVFLGPSFESGEIAQLIDSTPLIYSAYNKDEKGLLRDIASRIAAGKVIGWFQGRMEFGPRALGGRSILADPRDSDMRNRINAMVKKREGFRPFAPVVLEEKREKYFNLPHLSPFMLETCQVTGEMDLPAITHIDGSARVQTVSKTVTPLLYRLLQEFENQTGCPILLNTSFNVRGEPIVCSPIDALLCFINTEIDCLVLGDIIIDRDRNDISQLKKILEQKPPKKSGINHDVYSFF